MRTPWAVVPGLLAVLALPAAALDPGTAKGYLSVEGDTVLLSHAYALHQDNTEGVLDGPQLRILLTDREVAHDTIAGPLPWAIERLARAGAVRGVLLKLSAESPREAVNGTVLYPPSAPQAALPFFTHVGNDAGLKRLVIGEQRVVGEMDCASEPQAGPQGMPVFECAATFSAPIFQDTPVQADLKGRAARRSAPAKAFLAYEEALRSGELVRVEPLVTPAKYEELAAFVSKAGEARVRARASEAVPPRDARRRQIERVVVRGERATVIFTEPAGRSYQALVRVEGRWRVD